MEHSEAKTMQSWITFDIVLKIIALFFTFPLQLNEDWAIDSPSYKFTKLDVDNADHKKLVNDYLLMEGDFGGKKLKFNQGKIFK